jgi:hypothetical protein
MSEGWRKEKAFNNTNHNIEIRRHKNIDLSLHQSTIAASSSTTSIFAISCGKQDDGIVSGSASTVALRGFCTAPVDLWVSKYLWNEKELIRRYSPPVRIHDRV